MATRALSAPQPRSIGRSVLLTLPIVLWSALMFTPAFGHANRAQRIAAILTGAFMVVLFFLMMRTWKT